MSSNRALLLCLAEHFPALPAAGWTIRPLNGLTRESVSIEQKGVSKIDEGVRSEYIGIVNYCIMALIQLEKGTSETDDLSHEETLSLYQKNFLTAKELMLAKNHDYDEAWRQMRMSSYTDLILMKLKRTKQIEDNLGKTIISEGIEANYLDMINYAVFALIKIEF